MFLIPFTQVCHDARDPIVGMQQALYNGMNLKSASILIVPAMCQVR
jgi:hypothetical protein